jgi:hypothetical protein
MSNGATRAYPLQKSAGFTRYFQKNPALCVLMLNGRLTGCWAIDQAYI